MPFEVDSRVWVTDLKFLLKLYQAFLGGTWVLIFGCGKSAPIVGLSVLMAALWKEHLEAGKGDDSRSAAWSLQKYVFFSMKLLKIG